VDDSLTSALTVGFLLGLRHAVDADHVAAVSTFVGRHRDVYGSCVLGTLWGIGHAGALFLAAVAMILLRVRMPPGLDRVLEALVAVVVVALGATALVRALRSIRVHRHEHAHGGRSHRHLHFHAGAMTSHTHAHIGGVGKRPLLVGALHGLAGSAALVVVALATMPSAIGALLYVTVFGAGSTLGMVIVTTLIGAPFAVGRPSERARVALQFAVGLASLGVGAGMLRQLT
jgi:high-affinity nickel permease